MYIQKRLVTRLGYIFSLIFAIFAFSLPLASVASAQVRTGQLCEGANLSFGGSDKPCQIHNADGTQQAAADKATNLIAQIINLVSIVVGIIAVFMVLYGGFRFLTSAGNPESTKVAKNAILYAIIGLVIVALAQVIVKFVLAKITGTATT